MLAYTHCSRTNSILKVQECTNQVNRYLDCLDIHGTMVLITTYDGYTIYLV